MSSPGLLKLFLTLSLAGLVASLVAHVSTFRGAAHPLAPYLHIGIFVLIFPALSAARPGTGIVTRVSLGEAFAGAPKWATAIVWFFAAYAIVKFFIFFFHKTPADIPLDDMTPAEVQGFSSHWMLFYSAEALMFWAALRRLREATSAASAPRY